MKKITSLAIWLTSLFMFGQEYDFKYPQDANKKTEIKLSVTSLIAIAAFDASYERLVNEGTSYVGKYFF